jgi:integrase
VAVGHRYQATRSARDGFRSTPDNREAEDQPPEPKGLARIEVRRARASRASSQSAAREAAARSAAASIISKWAGHYDSAFTQKTYVHASEENLQRGQVALAKIHKIA